MPTTPSSPASASRRGTCSSASAPPRSARREGGRAGDRERERRQGGAHGRGPRARRRRAEPYGHAMSENAEYTAEEEERPCQCQAYLRATERAALVSARWLGRDDEAAAEEAAATGMRETLDVLPISGRVVFGSLDDSGGLSHGAIVGAGGKAVDLALDPL